MAFLAYINFEKLIINYRLLPQYKPAIRHATIKLDLTYRMNPDLSYQAQIERFSRTSSLLKKVEFIGTYKDRVTIRLYFASTVKNITEEEAKQELERITKTHGLSV